MRKKLVIAIDGPAGSGKSTVSKLIAQELGLLYLDTGAMYRALTLKVMRRGIAPEDTGAIERVAEEADIQMTMQPGEDPKVLLDGVDVSKEIRTPEVTQQIKHVACLPGVRAHMVRLQRAIAEQEGAVVEGRDIGTVVLHDAPLKFYLDASIEERARRRFKELKQMGRDVTLDEVSADVRARDTSDINRDVGPLKKAEDATRLDTTDLSIEEVVATLLGLIKGVSS